MIRLALALYMAPSFAIAIAIGRVEWRRRRSEGSR